MLVGTVQHGLRRHKDGGTAHDARRWLIWPPIAKPGWEGIRDCIISLVLICHCVLEKLPLWKGAVFIA